MVTVAAAATYVNPLDVTLGMLGLVFPCWAFAWDGLVRRQMAVPLFPFGSGLPGRAALISRLKAAAIGLLAALVGLFCLLFALHRSGCHPAHLSWLLCLFSFPPRLG
jgi:hypothetical protein